MLKKILVTIGCISLITASTQALAFGDDIETIEQARALCAPLSGLNYRFGKIIGYSKYGVEFVNESPSSAPEPIELDQNGNIKNAQFRLQNGIYGYEMGDELSCFYSYVSKDGGVVALVMSGED